MQEKKDLQETAAGTELKSEIKVLLERHTTDMEKHKADMESLKAEIQGQVERELEGERRRMEQTMAKLLQQLGELKHGILGAIGTCVSL